MSIILLTRREVKMKNCIIALCLLFSTYAKADDRSGVRVEYDDLMKSSGKWSFISSTNIVFGVLAGSASYYAYNRGLFYRDVQNHRELSPHETSEYKMWRGIADNAGYGAVGLFGVALMGTVLEMHYENRAHAFALDMGVKF